MVALFGGSNDRLNFFEVKALPRGGQLMVGLSPRCSVVLDVSLFLQQCCFYVFIFIFWLWAEGVYKTVFLKGSTQL